VEQTGFERALEPFPAIDPEPPRRFMFRRPTARTARWTFAGVCLVAAGIAAVALTWPRTAASPKHLATAFTDRDGVIVFEQQPSGALGTARPDGSGAKLLSNLDSMQGFDLPVVSPDDRFMVDEAGQVVALGPTRALSVTFSGGGAQLQSNFGNWQDESFADGDKFITAVECDGSVGASWQVGFASTSSSGTGTLGSPVDIDDSQPVAGDPQAEGAFAVPGASGECTGQNPTTPAHGDGGVVYERPKQAPRTVVTAAMLKQALGAAQGTPVLLSVYPSPDGSLLAVTVSSYTTSKEQDGGTYPVPTAFGTVIVTRNGQVAFKLPGLGEFPLHWAADGKRIATIAPSGHGWAMQVWPLTGRMQQIVIPGHDSQFPTQVLWSPDGSQLAVAWDKQTSTEESSVVQGWTVLDLRTKQVHTVTAPGQPAAWLPGQSGAR
jgi:hypothetical protein